VKTPEAPSRLRVLVRWLAASTTLVYVLARFLPSAPPVQHGEIEDSYIQVLHLGFLQSWQFGRDIIFTFGPWGFLYGGYHPETHLLALGVWLGLSIVFWWGGWKIARHFTGNVLLSWLWMILLTGIAGLEIFMMLDVRLMSFSIVWLALYFFVEDRSFTGAQAALLVALALLGLVKFTMLVQTVLLLLVVSGHTVVRYRRFPWSALLFGASTVFFWVLARQDLACLSPFVRSSLELTRGYTEAMMSTGAQGPALFLMTAILVLALAACAAWERDRSLSVFPLIAIAIMEFMAFKQGHVREDGHEVAAALVLLIISLVTFAAGWHALQYKWPLKVIATMLPTLLASFLAASTFRGSPQKDLFAALVQTFNLRELVLMGNLLPGRDGLRQGYQKYVGEIRDSHPAPKLTGTIDTYPGNAAALLAHGLAYRPRPVFQSYAVFTPQLAAINASSLRGENAPDKILFQITPIDGHFPTIEDGLCWPELITRYEVSDVEIPFIIFERSRTARPWKLLPSQNITARFGEQISIDSAADAPLWAEIEINATLAGAISGMLYKPSLIWMSIATRDGAVCRYRLVPGMVRSGFLLSPVIEDCMALATLMGSGEQKALSDKEVSLLSISADDHAGRWPCHESIFRLRTFRVIYETQDLTGVRGFRELKSLLSVNRRARLLRGDHRPEWNYHPRTGSVMKTSPGSAIQLLAEGPQKQLTVGFGILAADPGWQATNRIDFRVSAMPEEGEPILLWSQVVDPTKQGADAQHAVIDLTRHQSSGLLLETLPIDVSGKSPLECYWSQIEFE
jgi:hypothetical protein